MKNIILRRLPRIPALLAAFVAFVFAYPASGTTDTWTGASTTSANWSDPANWGGVSPSPGDQLVFAGTTNLNATNDFPAGTPFNSIVFSSTAGAFTLYGNPIVLSNAASAISFGVTNKGPAVETIDLDINLDWGFYTFNASQNFIELNGPVTVSPGGISYFSAFAGNSTIETTNLANDGSGLIGGLDGAGMIYNQSTTSPDSPCPVSFASIAYSLILPYNYATDPNAQTISDSAPTAVITSGTNQNLLINLVTTTVPQSNILTGTTYLNTILQTNLGNGTNYTIVTSAGSNLVMSQTGAILAAACVNGLPNSSSGTKNMMVIGGTGTLSAGGSVSNVPGTLILGCNGGGVGGSMTIVPSIVDNGTNGPVTVVKTGSGSLTLSTTDTYSGGTYVDQGYISVNFTGGLGSGPIYIASNAAILSWQSSTFTTYDFYLMPGAGFTGAPVPTSIVSRQAIMMGGTLHLQGNPVTYPTAGDRIGVEKIYITGLGGQITGTGTLDLITGSAATNVSKPYNYTNAPGFAFTNMTTNLNNWTGGLIINALSNNFCISKIFTNNQLASNSMTMVAVNRSNQFDLNGFNDTIGGLTSVLATTNVPATYATNIQMVNYGSNASTLTLGANNGSGIFGGLVSDNGGTNTLSIVKIGSGEQVFSGTCGYSGSTLVSAGTLALSNAATIGNSPAITVNSGATLDVSASAPYTFGASQVISGSGTIAGGTSVATVNGTVYPGGSNIAGTLAFSGAGGLTLGSAANVTFDLGSLTNGPGNDEITVAGPLALAGTLTINSSNLVSGTYTLFTCSGTPSGTPSVVFTGGSVPSSHTLNEVAGAVTLTVVMTAALPPPTPATFTSITLSAGQIILRGTNGVAGRNYAVLTSTNVGAPLTAWTRLITNQFNSLGGFSWTNSAPNGTSFYSILSQ